MCRCSSVLLQVFIIEGQFYLHIFGAPICKMPDWYMTMVNLDYNRYLLHTCPSSSVYSS